MKAINPWLIRSLVPLAMSLGFLTIATGPAVAVEQYPLVGDISSLASPHGEFDVLNARFGTTLALDGELTIVDTEVEHNQMTIQAFDRAGGYLWAADASSNYQNIGDVAVNENTGVIYVSEKISPGIIGVFNSKGTYLTEIDSEGAGKPVPGGLRMPHALAVDQASGDVYVYDRLAGDLDVFSAGGEYLFQVTAANEHSLSANQENVYLAVDEATDDLLMGHYAPGSDEQSVIYVFNATTGKYVTTWTGASTPQGAFFGLTKPAVNRATGEVIVAASGLTKSRIKEHKPEYTVEPAVVDRLTATGEYESQVRGFPGESFPGNVLYGVAVSPSSGEIYVLAKCAAYSSNTYEGQECPQSGPGELEVPGAIFEFAATPVAVPHVALEAPEGLAIASATLRGVVNPEGTGEASCEFEYGTTTTYGQHAPCPATIANGNAPAQVEVSIAGLKSGTTYHYRLAARDLADGATNLGEYGEAAGTFTTRGPQLVSESALDVSGEAASMQADLVPNGEPTSAYFEYGTSGAYGQSAPARPGVALGAGGTEVSLERRVQGLRPDTIYHYRMVALGEVEHGRVEAAYGEDHTFTTQAAAGSASLLDGRQWELVSPPDKLGALIEPLGVYALQAAADGGAIAYRTNSPSEARPQGYALAETALATRTVAGWSSRDISPPHDQSAGFAGYNGVEFRLFSPDLSQAALEPVSSEFTPLSGEATESTSYLREDFAEGDVETPCESDCYTPLVTRADDTASPFAPFGEEPSGACEKPVCGPTFRGASPDLSHVVLSSPAPLTSALAPTEGEGVYEWSHGHLELVGVLPKGEEGPAILAGSQGEGGETGFGARDTVSANGERVILEGGIDGGVGLYMREVGAGETLRLDALQGGQGPSAGLVYVAASSDASRVFFLDSGKLTGVRSAGGEDLYEYDVEAPPGERLTDLTADPGEAANVKTVIGASGDGSYVYFIATGALTDGATTGKLNLYVRHEAVTRLIAVMSPEDGHFFFGGGTPRLDARVSPNGRWLAFMSQAELTSYDNRDAVSGQPDAEVYLYGAGSGSHPPRLVCASCDPTGARPDGLKVNGGSLLSLDGLEEDQVAASVPSWTTIHALKGAIGTFYQPRYLSNGGRLFFDSSDALVPQDVNGAEDVYEYEPAEVGDCTGSSAPFAPLSGGCIDLVSSGTSPAESVFLDASETGGDVFFLTQAPLTPGDYDTAYDIYDARECTSASPCPSAPAPKPPPCEDESSCRAPAPPQPALYGAPASATFSGLGNVPVPGAALVPPPPAKKTVAKKPAKCKRGYVKSKKGKCVKRKPPNRKAHGAHGSAHDHGGRR